MSKQPQTKLHKVIEKVTKSAIQINNGAVVKNKESEWALDTVKGLKGLPHYCFDNSTYLFLSSDQTLETYKQLVQHGMDNLPYPQVLVEVSDEDTTLFCKLTQTKTSKHPKLFTAEIHTSGDSTFDSNQVIAVFTINPEDPQKSDYGFSTLDGNPIPAGNVKAGWKEDVEVACFILRCMVLSTYTKGMAIEEVDCKALNKSRKKKKRETIPSHTYIRIGKVYNREGGYEKVDGKNPVRMHWRSGYVRNQRHGPGNKLVKPVWIDPVIVNYNENEEMLAPNKKVGLTAALRDQAKGGKNAN